MDKKAYEAVLEVLNKATFDRDKLDAIKAAARAKHFTLQQVMPMVHLFTLLTGDSKHQKRARCPCVLNFAFACVSKSARAVWGFLSFVLEVCVFVSFVSFWV